MSLVSALLARAAAAPAAPGSLDLLNALRDIHEPPAPGLWPPAPGWWLLTALLIAALAALFLHLRRRYRRARPVRAGLAELDRWIADARSGGDPAAHAERLAALLRRVALIRYPRSEVAALTGEAWLQFLDRTGSSDAFTAGPGRVLGNDRYAPGVALDVDALGAIARRWLEEHLGGPIVEADRTSPEHRRDVQEIAVRKDEPKLRGARPAAASPATRPGAEPDAPGPRNRHR